MKKIIYFFKKLLGKKEKNETEERELIEKIIKKIKENG